MIHRRSALLVIIGVASIAVIALLVWKTSVRSQSDSPLLTTTAPAPVAPEPSLDHAVVLQSPAAAAPEDRPSLEAAEPIRSEASGSGGTHAGITLNVAVVDELDRPITTGEIECWWGGAGFSLALAEGHTLLPIADRATPVALPITAMEALVVARNATHAPAQTRVPDLRRSRGVWSADDTSVTHEVTVKLAPAGPPSSGIWGSIFVDDQPRTPAGLAIVAQAAPDDEIASRPPLTPDGQIDPAKLPRYRPPDSALIDPSRNEYRIEGLPEGRWLLGAKSEASSPQWTRVELVPSSIAKQVDLHLVTGPTLVLHARDAVTLGVVAGVQVRLESWVEQGRTTKAVSVDPIRLEATCDGNGMCTFRGLPLDSLLLVRTRESSEPILKLKIQPSDPPEVHRDLWIGGPDPSLAACWGYVPEAIADREANEESGLRILARGLDAPGGLESADCAGSKWNLTLAPNARYELWLARGSERVSVKREIRTRAGSQGPIELAPLTLGAFRLAWRNAPVGCTLELQGVPGRVEKVLLEREGVLELQRASDAGISLKVPGADGGFLSMGWADSALTDELSVDLRGDHQITAAVFLNGAAPEGSSELFLYPLERPAGTSHVIAMLPLRSGTSTRVPALTGPHFFKLVAQYADGTPPSVAVATGVVDVPAGESASLKIEWNGEALARPEWSTLGRAGFVVTSCGGRDLEAVHPAARRFGFKDMLLRLPDAGSGTILFFDRAHCATLPWEP